MLDLNITMLIQMVNFFIALYVLNFMLIKPIRGILEERRQKMDGLTGDAEAFEREAKERIESYQAELSRARQEGTALRDAARNEGMAEQHGIVSKAGQTAQEELAAAKAAIRAEADATTAELKKQVDAFAQKIATRVMA